MKVNKRISAMLVEIATEGAKLESTKLHRRESDKNVQISDSIEYYRRILKIYDSLASNDERVYLLKYLMLHLHLKSVITDPDNVATIYNVKLKTILFVFLLTSMLMILIAILFKTNDSLNTLIGDIFHVFNLLSLVD